VDIDFCDFDHVHLLGEGATHSPAPCSPRHAAQANPRDTTGYRCGLPLQGAAQPEAGPVRAVPKVAQAPLEPRHSPLPGTPITALASAFNYGF